MTSAVLELNEEVHAAPSLEKILTLESILLNMPQVDLKTRHYFANGLVAREITIPAGVTLTGAAHKDEHLATCFGDITVWTEDGMKRITGFSTMTAKPGCKRVGFAHAETVWTTYHANPDNETDIAKLEEFWTDDAAMLQSRILGLTADKQELIEV